MWSIGVICYALLCGRLPIDIDDNDKAKDQDKNMLNRIVNFNSKYECFSKPCFTELGQQPRDFLQMLLVKNPEERWSAKMAMDHPWITGFWEQMLGNLQDDIKKNQKIGKLGESITIRCIKSLKDFR